MKKRLLVVRFLAPLMMYIPSIESAAQLDSYQGQEEYSAEVFNSRFQEEEPQSPTPLLVGRQPSFQQKPWFKDFHPVAVWTKNICCFDYEQYPERGRCKEICAPTCCKSKRGLRLCSIASACSYWVVAATIFSTAAVTECICWGHPSMSMSVAGKAAGVGVTLGVPLACNAVCSKCPCDYSDQELRAGYTVSWLDPFISNSCRRS